jgi:hypothetical protein
MNSVSIEEKKMSNTVFSIYDFTVNGFKKTLDNIKLFVLSALAFMGVAFAAMLGALVIVSPILFRIWPILASFKQAMTTMMAQGTGIVQGGMGMMPGGMMAGGMMSGAMGMMGNVAQMKINIWKQISPLLTTMDFVLMTLAVLFVAVVMVGLVVGFLRIVLDVVDTGSSSVSRLLSCFHLAPRFLVASLISVVVVLFGFMLLIVPGVILTLRLRFFPYYIIDKNNGAIESLKASWHATKGLEWEILGLIIVSGVLAAFIPVLGIPVSCFMLAFAYRVLPK